VCWYNILTRRRVAPRLTAAVSSSLGLPAVDMRLIVSSRRARHRFPRDLPRRRTARSACRRRTVACSSFPAEFALSHATGDNCRFARRPAVSPRIHCPFFRNRPGFLRRLASRHGLIVSESRLPPVVPTTDLARLSRRRPAVRGTELGCNNRRHQSAMRLFQSVRPSWRLFPENGGNCRLFRRLPRVLAHRANLRTGADSAGDARSAVRLGGTPTPDCPDCR